MSDFFNFNQEALILELADLDLTDLDFSDIDTDVCFDPADIVDSTDLDSIDLDPTTVTAVAVPEVPSFPPFPIQRLPLSPEANPSPTDDITDKESFLSCYKLWYKTTLLDVLISLCTFEQIADDQFHLVPWENNCFEMIFLVSKSACSLVASFLTYVNYDCTKLSEILGKKFQIIEQTNLITRTNWKLELHEILVVLYNLDGIPRNDDDQEDTLNILVNSKITQFYPVS